MADPDPTAALHEHPHALEVARLLVRESEVSLPRIASVLGFANPDRFAEWFETRAGRHPDRVRSGEGPGLVDPTDDMLLCHVRRNLIAPVDRQTAVRLFTALRDRQPLPFPVRT